MQNRNLCFCEYLKDLPGALGKLTALTCLNLSFCSSLSSLPDLCDQLHALAESCSISIALLFRAFGQHGRLHWWLWAGYAVRHCVRLSLLGCRPMSQAAWSSCKPA